MPRRLVLLMMIACAASATTASSAAGKSSWPSRATALSSTLGWFQAINAHDRQRLLWYVAPSARGQMGWARPSAQWSRFTDLHCHGGKNPGGGQVRIRCTFHESASPTEGNPDNFWDVYLEHTKNGWLIVNYGQG